MNIASLFNKSFLALSKENELELCYLFGNNLKNINYMKLKKPWFSGFLFQILVFFFKLFRNFSFFDSTIREKPILIYSGTKNQFQSLESTIKSLRYTKLRFNYIVAKNVEYKNSNYQITTLKFSFKISLVCIALFLKRFYSLYFKLLKKNYKTQISWYLNLFCESYSYVPYFLNLLSQSKPKLVIIANDHSLDCRCLRLAAETLNIKTLYIQHASVTKIFPALEFDFALLDGFVAYETYKSCYKKKNNNKRIKKNAAKCKVLLTGQKKIIYTSRKKINFKNLHIGLAINALDDINYVIALLDHLSLMNIKCVVRPHPGQSLVFIKKLKTYIKDNRWITWSDPKKYAVRYFFKCSDIVVAGNSSIHLEAGLSGLPTFYCEMSSSILKPDYYSFVKNGITQKIKYNLTYNELKNLIKKNINNKKRDKALKNYSETYKTYWQNFEGDLTQEVIQRILNNKSFSDLFKFNRSNIYSSLHRLKLHTQ